MSPPVRIEDWSVVRHPDDRYRPPARTPIHLHGAVYGHPDFADGHYITTSEVISSKGRTARCLSRSYLLGKPSANFLAWLSEAGMTLDENEPIKFDK